MYDVLFDPDDLVCVLDVVRSLQYWRASLFDTNAIPPIIDAESLLCLSEVDAMMDSILTRWTIGV